MFDEQTKPYADRDEPTTSIQVYLLGSLRIEQHHQPIHLPCRKVEALLAYLLLHPEQHAHDPLATLFWADSTDEKARHSLHTALAALRQILGDSLLLSDHDHVQINPDFPIWVDLYALLAWGKQVDALDLTDPSELRSMLALWRAELLAGFYDDWIMVERQRYHTRLLKFFLTLTQALRTASEYAPAIEVAQKILVFEPANEHAHQHLMFCYMATCDHSAAIRQYEQCARALDLELGTLPRPETLALYQSIKQRRPEEGSLQAKITNLPIPLTSFVGRTLQMREIKWMIKAASNQSEQNQARLLTLVGAGGCGKTRLVIQVATDLIDSFANGVWWVDLTTVSDGALVARALAKALGVNALDEQKLPQVLANYLDDKQLLLVIDNCEHLIDACSTLLATLLSSAPRLQILATSREALHIGGETLWHVPTLTLPDQAQRNLSNNADLDFLLQTECVRLFVERAAAVQQGFRLTSENAQSVFEICERLDGIPLAIELAAARVRVLSVEQIAAYLTSAIGARFALLTQSQRSALPRQQTLLATIDWSYNLLDENERLFFRQAAVFQGGFTLEALQEILDLRFEILDCGPSAACLQIQNLKSKIQNPLDLLTQLIDKSLIIAESEGSQKRYRLLESLREYAWGRLASSAELETLQQQHANFFLRLAEQAATALQSIDQKLWLERLTLEYGNLHAALTWFEKKHQVEAGLCMGRALEEFWYRRGYFREGQRWLETFLQLGLDETKDRALCIDVQSALAALNIGLSNFVVAQTLFEQNLILSRRIDYIVGVEDALIGLGTVYWELGDYPSATPIIDEALHLCRSTQHLAQVTRAANIRGLIDWSLGNVPAAIDRFCEALALARKAGDLGKVSTFLFNLANMKSKQGDYAESRRLYEESIAISRQLGDEAGIADVLINLGSLAIDQGEFAVAARYLHEAAQINNKLGDHADVAYSLCHLAGIAFYSEQYAEAQQQYQEALALFRTAGNKRMMGRALAGLGHIACRQGNLVMAATLCAEALTLRYTIGHKAGVLFSLEASYVELALAVDQPVVAARLLAATDSLYEEISTTRPPLKTTTFEELCVKVQAQLGAATFANAWGEGQLLSLDQAVTLALSIRTLATETESETGLRFCALGPARVYDGKRLLTSADWTYDKARELVFYLLCQPNSSQAEIGLHFWPDATAEQVRKRFSAALSHARNALGRQTEWIIRANGHYRFDPARAVCFDVDLFEAKVKAAKLQIKNNQSTELVIQLLEEALSLYQGDFVEDLLDGEWQQARRATLRNVYLDALMTLASLHAAAHQFDRAIPLYQRALVKDPYLEEAHTGLMRSFSRLNQRGQALRQYDALVVALADLGVVPSVETQTLLQRLSHGEPL